jgi:hypothetical protein
MAPPTDTPTYPVQDPPIAPTTALPTAAHNTGCGPAHSTTNDGPAHTVTALPVAPPTPALHPRYLP